MDNLLIFLKGVIKIIKYFFPVFLFTVVGLAYISWVERKEESYGKHNNLHCK